MASRDRLLLPLIISLAAVGCSDSPPSVILPDFGHATPVEDETRDILDTALVVDLMTSYATATIHLAPSATSAGASFEVGDLKILDVSGPQGPLPYLVTGKRLDVTVPTGGSSPVELTVTYQIRLHHNFDGVLAQGLTFTWPYFCGDVFPCHSAPADGLQFVLCSLNPQSHWNSVLYSAR